MKPETLIEEIQLTLMVDSITDPDAPTKTEEEADPDVEVLSRRRSVWDVEGEEY